MRSEPGNRSQRPLKSANTAVGTTLTTSPSGPVLNFTNQPSRGVGGAIFSNYQLRKRIDPLGANVMLLIRHKRED